MINIRSRIVEVLSKGHLMSLGTVDEGGPWVADVIYIFDDDLTLYWMSDPRVRHSQALLKEKRVAGAITAEEKLNLGVQFAGLAEKIEGVRFDLAVKHLTKRGLPKPSKALDVLRGYSWYMLKPNFFDLIDEENFGFEKKKLTL